MGHPVSRTRQQRERLYVEPKPGDNVIEVFPENFISRSPRPFDNLPILSGPGEMDLMMSLFRQLIVEVTFDLGDEGRQTLNLQFDGLLMPHSQIGHFRARVFRIVQTKRGIQVGRDGYPVVTGYYMTSGKRRGWLHLPNVLGEHFDQYSQGNLSAHEYGPFYNSR